MTKDTNMEINKEQLMEERLWGGVGTASTEYLHAACYTAYKDLVILHHITETHWFLSIT